MSALDAAWETLEAQVQPRAGWHTLRVHPDAPCAIRAGVRRPSGARGLLLEVPAAAIPTGVEYPECGGFVVSPETIVPGPGGKVRLCVEERSPHWREIFAVMAAQVSQHLSRSPGPAAAVASLLARLAAWQRFMASHGPGRLSEEACAGLAAELLVLEMQVLPAMPALAAIDAWRGPTGAPQDFRFGSALVEVKGSTSAAPSSFRVSNLEQLSGEAGLPLLICHVAMSVAPGGRTLPELVATVRAAIPPEDEAAAAQLEELLFEAGFLDAHAASYQSPPYAVRAVRRFRVEEGFPRITPDSAPSGVLSAIYSVSLAACAPFEITPGEYVGITGTAHV